MDRKIEEAKEIIKEEVEKAGLKVVKIILFGSRIRGDYKEDSDWDFYVVVDKDIKFNEMKKLIGKIQLRLAELNLPNDLILRGINQFEKAKKIVGNISYYAAKEGIEI